MARLRAKLSRAGAVIRTAATRLLAIARPRVAWQGPIGAALITAGAGELAGRGWALVVAGVFFLAATAFASLGDR